MATELEKLLVRIEADTSKLRSEMKKAGVEVEQSSKKIENSLGGIGTAIKGIAIGALTKELISAGAQMQQLNARMTATTGSAKAAGEAMGFLRQMANEQSVDLIDLADGYNRLLPSVNSGIISMEQMRETLRLANDNIKAFGLNSSESQGLFLGLSQALGSGTVTMEDLRQVTDRLPGSLNKIAESAGMSVNQFKKLVSTGELTADVLMGPLLEAFRANEGAAASMAGTFDAATTRMRNAFRDTMAAIAESGILDAAVAGMEQLANAMQFVALLTMKMRIEFNRMTGDTEELKDLMASYNDTLLMFNDKSAKATEETKKFNNALTGGGSGGGSAGTVPSVKAATKAIEEQKDKLQEYIRAMQQENTLLQLDERTRNRVKAVIDAQNIVMDEGNILTKEQIRLIEQLADKNYDLSNSYESAADAAKRLQETTLKLGNDTVRVLESIKNGDISGGLSAGGDMLGGVLDQLGIGGSTASGILGMVGVASQGAAIGNIFGSLIGGHEMGSSIGGGIGSIAGTMLGGPLGGLVGSLAGSAIGGMFGSTPHPASTFGAQIGANDNLTGINLLSKHTDTSAARNMMNIVQGVLGSLIAGGTDLAGVGVHGGIDNGTGFFQIGEDLKFMFDPSNEQSMAAALIDFTEEMARSADVVQLDLVKALQDMQVEGRTLQEVLNDINFAATKDVMRDQFNAGVERSILQLTDPVEAQRQEILDAFNTAKEQAGLLGADVTLLEKLRDLQLEKLDLGAEENAAMQEAAKEAQRLSDQFYKLQESIDATLNSLQLGGNSFLSPQEQFQLAADTFRSLVGKTDAESLSRIGGAAQTLAEQNRQFYGVGSEGASVFNEIISGLQGASAYAGSAAGGYASQANSLLAQIAAEQAKTNAKLTSLAAESSVASYAA